VGNQQWGEDMSIQPNMLRNNKIINLVSVKGRHHQLGRYIKKVKERVTCQLGLDATSLERYNKHKERMHARVNRQRHQKQETE
jgi:hypothetical protein